MIPADAGRRESNQSPPGRLRSSPLSPAFTMDGDKQVAESQQAPVTIGQRMLAACSGSVLTALLGLLTIYTF